MLATLLALTLPFAPFDDLALSTPNPRVLVFSKTAGFRHDSIPTGVQTIQDLGGRFGFRVTATEDANVFSRESLSNYDVVVFLCTTGDVLNGDQEIAFQDFVEGGGGYVGLHAAADTEYDWPFYGKTAGAYFKTHPAIQKAKVKIEDRTHATSYFLPAEWERTDEWYTYRANPRKTEGLNVLAALDESTYQGGGMDGDHPITWWQEIKDGRAWYTGFGHTKETYAEPDFQRMLGEAIVWAAQGKRPTGASDVRFESVEGWFIEKGTRGGTTEAILRNQPGANKHLVGATPHGDCLLHVEFRIPKGSNSGVYLQGRYEVQILDSFGKEKGALLPSDCGGIYERWKDDKGYDGKAPDWNAFAGPGRWNTYDIRFQAPRFEGGKKIANAKFLEVRLNGVLIQKNFECTGPTRAAMAENEAPLGTLLLQGDHGPIEYRNVWIRSLG